MPLDLFWLEAPTSHTREFDPLGFGTIHEAASNRVLPFLTERTRSADEYLYALAGLRWASDLGGSDGECWRLFERFEKGLKLSWIYLLGRTFGFRGVDAVKSMKDARRVDLDFELIAQQRSQGLLGSYLTSLRSMKLVEERRLVPTQAGLTLIDQSRFEWDGDPGTTAKWLHIFKNLTFTRGQRRRLAARLFGSVEMIAVSRAIRKLGAAPGWHRAWRALAGEARIVASSARAFGRLASKSLQAFYSLLRAPDTEPRFHSVTTFSPSWSSAIFQGGLTRLAAPFNNFTKAIGRRVSDALVTLHGEVWEQRGHKAPWFRRDSDGRLSIRRDTAVKAIPAASAWDHRWEVCHNLIRQTGWDG